MLADLFIYLFLATVVLWAAQQVVNLVNLLFGKKDDGPAE